MYRYLEYVCLNSRLSAAYANYPLPSELWLARPFVYNGISFNGIEHIESIIGIFDLPASQIDMLQTM